MPAPADPSTSPIDWRALPDLPPRIWIVGHCGAGKSYVCAKLAQRMGVEPTHIDDIHWNPGWVESVPDDELRILDGITRRDAWVIDGNYGHLRDAYGRRADLFIWLDLPFAITFPRLVWRCVSRAFTGEEICNGNTESWRQTFLSPRHSMLWWAITSHRWRSRTLAADIPRSPHLRLRGRRAINAFLHRHAGTR
jgi:adenylate kinase family enzyme